MAGFELLQNKTAHSLLPALLFGTDDGGVMIMREVTPRLAEDRQICSLSCLVQEINGSPAEVAGGT